MFTSSRIFKMKYRFIMDKKNIKSGNKERIPFHFAWKSSEHNCKCSMCIRKTPLIPPSTLTLIASNIVHLVGKHAHACLHCERRSCCFNVCRMFLNVWCGVVCGGDWFQLCVCMSWLHVENIILKSWKSDEWHWHWYHTAFIYVHMNSLLSTTNRAPHKWFQQLRILYASICATVFDHIYF